MQEHNKVDFHVHYTDTTAEQILRSAAKHHLVAVGLIGRAEISDRINQFVELGRELGVKVFPGVECLSRIDNKFFDLIALGVDPQHPAMRRYFGVNEGVELNARIAEHQIKFLESQGFEFNNLSAENQILFDKIQAGEVTEKAIKLCQICAETPECKKVVNRLQNDHEEEWLETQNKYGTRPGYIDHPSWVPGKFLYCHYFMPGKPGYYPTQPLAADFIAATHKARGVILYSPEGSFDLAVWNELLELNIDGIMGWHAGEMEVDKQIILNARRNGLLVLGGSDYHPDKNHWQIGNGSGKMYISQRRLFDIEQRLAALQKLQP